MLHPLLQYTCISEFRLLHQNFCIFGFFGNAEPACPAYMIRNQTQFRREIRKGIVGKE
ncbi:hypothetical protein HanXRQr2_Chr09g0372641 [Helianthus annuus]|uniref:Uncharacterized protein n=1 Tax=Helianthus annuus TaxID=4232 RepID=A0A9K3I3W9_HELAN|nr:hypothetical protein HanXRQr2_Chr09g0372641 [Helianthus annuus]KAJ0891865.1 hypothetical protein HanPSC8_Chr09g0359161 [Helianthus annuus]